MKNEYVIPGLENVGVPGNRRAPSVQKIDEAINAYKKGNGAIIDSTGKLVTATEARTSNPSDLSMLSNIQTSMDDGSIAPYLRPNVRKDRLIPSLAEAVVTVVGLGGGAPIPVELAKCGVGNFHFFDLDQLDADNLIRHPCGIEYVGLSKVDAVSQYLMRQSGGHLHVHRFSEDVFVSANIRASVAESDLLIVATDNEASRFFLNEIAVEHGTPAVFVGMFEGGMGGEIFAAYPGQGCYCCLAEHIGRKRFIESYAKAVRKGDCSSVRDTSAMPGLGIDQGLLCQIAARKSLDILLQNKNHQLRPVGKNWIVFSICGIDQVLAESLTSIQMDIARHASCMSCA